MFTSNISLSYECRSIQFCMLAYKILPESMNKCGKLKIKRMTKCEVRTRKLEN